MINKTITDLQESSLVFLRIELLIQPDLVP